MAFEIDQVRAAFHILQQPVNGKPLVYLDNGATTQKPEVVLQRILDYYRFSNSNVHRGVHKLSQLATEQYEQARQYIASYINAPQAHEVIFTRGTTESVNLVAGGFDHFLHPNEEVLLTRMEHHSNIVPWQQLCERRNAKLGVVSVDENGALNLKDLEQQLTSRTKLLALTHISNVLGTINPIREIVEMAHKRNIPVFVDGAQAIAHVPVDVQELGCDFYAFSGHKSYGPMGIGVLYGKSEWLDKLPPYQFGGEMIKTVSFEKTTFSDLPYKFEAGTPNVAGALGLEAAIRFMADLGMDQIMAHEDHLLAYASERLLQIDGLQIIGNAAHKTAVLSFVVDGVHAYDIGTLLDQMGVAVRTGNHCAQPMIDALGLPAVVRATIGLYNTQAEMDVLVSSLEKAVNMLR